MIMEEELEEGLTTAHDEARGAAVVVETGLAHPLVNASELPWRRRTGITGGGRNPSVGQHTCAHEIRTEEHAQAAGGGSGGARGGERARRIDG
jgi:hypothetical protein